MTHSSSVPHPGISGSPRGMEAKNHPGKRALPLYGSEDQGRERDELEGRAKPPNDLIQIMDNLRWAWGLLMGAQ